MREISEKCYRCECYWQNCDTDTECEGMKEPCHEFRECKRLKGEAKMNKQEIEKAIEVIKKFKYFADLVETPEEYFRHMQGHTKELSLVLNIFDMANLCDDLVNSLEYQQTNGWIPVSERLPIYPCRCYITIKYRDGYLVREDIYINGEWTKYKDAIAWREKETTPQPYKEELE